ncbi:hypothetical protein TWF106_001355 [Orbilia oligospora]|uniref:Uncharacterized protein n=1 Tax=Orbilia oligospora TaxID=2813651 RepID=A0A6G1MFB8_ORBOL|nr:hypothetical protein TWF679_010113 [Orbilia oligospora]KAF3204950.1 hypothetical protein TWF106_001355 [Orbilia oligospora]KAF3220905.1 hypothetical protein TWF191_007363 [Orbilia oligospora]KAF3257071.1 hypothetical protein TWF192_001353 [Orbilia oligospora]
MASYRTDTGREVTGITITPDITKIFAILNFSAWWTFPPWSSFTRYYVQLNRSTQITGFNPAGDLKDILDHLPAGDNGRAADPNLTELPNRKRGSSIIDFDSDVLLKIDIDNGGSDPTRVEVEPNVLLDGQNSGRGKTHVIVKGDVFAIPAGHPFGR